MKKCLICDEEKEATEFRGKLKQCKSCRGSENLPAVSSKHFKWKVPIQTCQKGFSYVPTDKGCEPCFYKKH